MTAAAETRDRLNVSKRVKRNRNEELSKIVRHKRGRNLITPWKAGRKYKPRQEKSAAYSFGFMMGVSNAI